MTSKSTREENVQAVFDLKAGYTLGLADVEILKRVARMALAAMDSEPVAWLAIYHGEVYDEAIGITRSVVEAQADHFGWELALTEIIPLYRHAQPAPAVTFYRDGIEAAAKWIDQQREAYDSEHGRHDTGTGFFEFGNDAQREYSSTLEELAEGIRALHPNAGNSPVILDGYVMVPKQPTERMVIDGFESEPDETFSEPEVWEAFQKMSGCEQAAYRARLCWAAMLAAAPPAPKQENI